MMSIFPHLLNYSLVSPLILRIILAVTFGWIGYAKIKTHEQMEFRSLGVVEIIMALFLLVGLMTQLMALLTAVILAVKLVVKIKDGAFLTDGVNYYLVLLMIAISLIFTGPGLLAFDLPL